MRLFLLLPYPAVWVFFNAPLESVRTGRTSEFPDYVHVELGKPLGFLSSFRASDVFSFRGGECYHGMLVGFPRDWSVVTLEDIAPRDFLPLISPAKSESMNPSMGDGVMSMRGNISLRSAVPLRYRRTHLAAVGCDVKGLLL